MKYKVSKIQKKIIYISFIVGLVGIVLLLLPVWNIQAINIPNASIYTEEEIQNATGIKKGMHILSISKGRSLKELKKLAYIKDASIEISFPNTVNILIEENTPLGYVPFNGAYLCIGNDGQVLAQNDKPKLELPIIVGLKFNKFKVNEKLAIMNDDNFMIVAEMISTLRKYDFLDKIDTIDISNVEQIHLYVDKLDVIIGNIREFDKKVMWLTQVHKDYTIGILDLSMIQLGQAILTPLT